MQHDSSYKPLLAAVLGVGVLTVMDALIKLLSASFGTLEVMTIRYASGLLFTSIMFAVLRPGWPNRQQWPRHLLRIAILLITSSTFFYAIAKLPLAEVFVIVSTAPLFMALFGRLVLGERLHASAGFAIALGFAGMLMIVVTRGEGLSFGKEGLALLAAVVSPMAYAMAMVLMRKQSGDEPLSRILFLQTLLGLAAVAPLTWASFPPPTGAQLWLALGIGALGTLGSLLLGWAFKHAPAARMGVADYTGLIWAVLLGFLIFGEVPRVEVWFGAIFIIGGCLLVLKAPPRAVAASVVVPPI